MIDGLGLLFFGKFADNLPSNFLASLSRDLRIINSGTKAQAWAARSFLIFSAFILASVFGVIVPLMWWLLPSGIILSFLHLVYPSWKAGIVVEDLRDKVPSALLSSASSLQAGQTPEEVMLFLSKKAEPPLNILFQKTVSLSTRERVELGAGLQKVLSIYRTPEFDRMSGLLAIGIQSGANLHSLFNTVARDLLVIRELRKEQVQQMASLKYILFLSGVVLIPSILALSAHLSSLLGYQESGLLLASQISFFPFSIVLAATIAYFCDFAPKKALIYAPVLLLVQFFTFNSVLVFYPKI